MDNRENIVAEYFQLRMLLNKTNLKKDEKTEIEFLLRHDQRDFWVVASLKKTSPSKTIEICRKKSNGRWARSECTGLFNLEDYCAETLNKCTPANPKASEMEVLITDLNKALSNLGVPR